MRDMNAPIRLDTIAKRFGLDSPRAAQIARRFGIPLETYRTKTVGRPPLVLRDERDAARLALALRLRRLGIRHRLVRRVLNQVSTAAAVRVHGKAVLVDGTGEWRDVLTGQFWLPLPLPSERRARRTA